MIPSWCYCTSCSSFRDLAIACYISFDEATYFSDWVFGYDKYMYVKLRDMGEDGDALLISSFEKFWELGQCLRVALLLSGQKHRLRLGTSYLSALNQECFCFLPFGFECLSRGSSRGVTLLRFPGLENLLFCMEDSLLHCLQSGEEGAASLPADSSQMSWVLVGHQWGTDDGTSSSSQQTLDFECVHRLHLSLTWKAEIHQNLNLLALDELFGISM